MAMFIQKPWYNQSGGGGLKIVSFADGTDAEIAAMLDAYYDNELTWSEMGWAVGDMRVIHVDQRSAPDPKSDRTLDAQNIRVVILDHDHTKLATPINGHTNSCITVQFQEVVCDRWDNSGTYGTIYVDGTSSKTMTYIKWSDLYMRTYINSTLLNAMTYSTNKGSGTSFKDMIKPSKHYRSDTFRGTSSEEVTDTLFLPSYPEIFGAYSYSYYTATNPSEGTQFSYFTTTSNRIKYINNNGSRGSDSMMWWNGSNTNYYEGAWGYDWCCVKNDGTPGKNDGNIAYGLAPAWAM